MAAVAATVAGVVALAIGATSDAAENRATYTPSGPAGAALVTAYDAVPSDWPEFERAIRTQVPGAHITAVRGLSDGHPAFSGSPAKVEVASQLTFRPITRGNAPDGYSYTSSLGSMVLAGKGALDALGLDMSRAQRTAAVRTLDAGGVVLFAYDYDKRSFSQAAVTRSPDPSDGSKEPTEEGTGRCPPVSSTSRHRSPRRSDRLGRAAGPRGDDSPDDSAARQRRDHRQEPAGRDHRRPSRASTRMRTSRWRGAITTTPQR